MTASTGVFVSCEDYGDDIAHLQEQIDQNAAAADSKLAAQVAALQSQLSTLEAAQESLKEQLATAKAEAATAANNALAAAQAAQAAADKAQAGADDAKAAAAAAQAAADQANNNLSAAVTRVAVLEAKVASLEATITELSASNKELTTKLNDLQLAFNSLNTTVGLNSEAIKAIKADIIAKTADLAAQIAAVSAEFSGKIDAINAELNKIKADYALKADLNKTAADLAQLKERLDQQIAANEAYEAEMAKVIGDLKAADEAAAALIAANHEETMAEIKKINEALEAQKAAVEKQFEEVKAQIKDLDEVVASLTQMATTNYNDIADLRASLQDKTTEIHELIQSLIVTDRGFAAQIEQLLTNVNDLNTFQQDADQLIHELILADRGFTDQIDQILTNVQDLNVAAADMAQQIVELIGCDKGFAEQIELILVNYQEFKDDYDSMIVQLIGCDNGFRNDIAKLMEESYGFQEAIKGLNTAIAALEEKDAKMAADIKELFALAKAHGDNLNDLKAEIMALKDRDVELAKDITELFALLADVEGDIDVIKADVAALDGNLEALGSRLDKELGNLNALIAENADAAKAAQDAADALGGRVDALETWKAEFEESYAKTLETVNNALSELDKLNTALNTTNGVVAGIKADVDALLSRLQSVVFIPQYMDANNVVITPIYAYTNATYESDGKTVKDVPAIFKMNFRVKPAELVDDLIGLFNADSAIVKLYVEEALQTRAADKESAKVLSIEQDENDLEVITVTASAPRLGSQLDDEKAENAETKYYPATLAIAAENSKSDFTTEYFNLVEREITDLDGEIFPNDGIDVIEGTDTLDICYVHIDTVRNVLAETHVVYPEAISAIYSQDLQFFGGYIDGTLYKYSDTDEWKTFLEKALKLGFEFHANAFTFEAAETKEGHAIHANIGNHITLAVADETFGFNASGLPNAEYHVTYKITEATADRAYDFGTVSKVWDPVTGSEMFALLDTIALETFTVEGVKVATPEELEVALRKAVDNVTYDAKSDVNFGYTFKDGKAIVKYIFPEKTNYAKEGGYSHAITFSTEYGKVNFVGHVSLAYPTDFLVHEPRFTEGVTGKFIVEAGNQVVINDGVPAYRDGKVGSSLPAAYTNYALYTQYANVKYEFSFTGASNEELALGTKNFLGHSVTYNDYLSVLKKLENEEGVVITVKVTVDDHEVASESYGIDVLYPVEGRNLRLNGASSEDNMQTILASSLYNNQTVSVIGNVYLEDRYNNVLFKDGVAVSRDAAVIKTNAGVWGIKSLEYELVNAYSASGHKVTSVSVDKNGNLSIVDPNISEDVTVIVRVKTVGYTYGEVDGEFSVLIQKTYGEYPAN